MSMKNGEIIGMATTTMSTNTMMERRKKKSESTRKSTMEKTRLTRSPTRISRGLQAGRKNQKYTASLHQRGVGPAQKRKAPVQTEEKAEARRCRGSHHQGLGAEKETHLRSEPSTHRRLQVPGGSLTDGLQESRCERSALYYQEYLIYATAWKPQRSK